MMADKFTTVLIIISAAAVVLTSCADEKDRYDWMFSGRAVISSGRIMYPCVAVDFNDVVHIAWMQGYYTPNYRRDIFYTNSANREMIMITNISNTDCAEDPEIVINSNNVVYIGWTKLYAGEAEIYIANSTDWAGTRTSIPNLPSMDSMVIDSNDIVHILGADGHFEGVSLIYANSTDWTGTTSTVIQPVNYFGGCAMAVDSVGVIHIAWTDYDLGPNYNIWYANSSDGFTAKVNISNTADTCFDPRMMIDSSDVVHVTWMIQNAQGRWIETAYANSEDWVSTRNTIPVHSYHYQVTMNSSNIIHMVWEEVTSDDVEIFYANSSDWFATVKNASNTRQSGWRSERPSIAVDSTGVAHIVWEEKTYDPHREVWYTRLAR